MKNSCIFIVVSIFFVFGCATSKKTLQQQPQKMDYYETHWVHFQESDILWCRLEWINQEKLFILSTGECAHMYEKFQVFFDKTQKKYFIKINLWDINPPEGVRYN